MDSDMSGGNGYSPILTFAKPPERVVSLVPSATDSLFALGAGRYLVGVTDFCRPPKEALDRLSRVGGTKSPAVEAILKLKPELVIANQEENSRQTVEALEAAGIKVWVTFPRSVDEALRMLWILIRLFDVPQSAPILKTLEVTLAWQDQAVTQRPLVRTFSPIWQEQTSDGGCWWMTFNRDTYAHSVLGHCGGANVFADRLRRYPLEADLGQIPAEDAGERDTRYPRVALPEVLEAAPEVVLLPSEPFAFTPEDAVRFQALLADTPAARNQRIHLVDGSLLTWHGTRLAKALAELPAYFDTAPRGA